MVVIAVDAMTPEKGLMQAVIASNEALSHDDKLKVLLVGDEALLNVTVSQHVASQNLGRITVVAATDVVLQTDEPGFAIRRRLSSSTHTTIRLVKDGHADAAVSCANTGVLVGLSRYYLKRLPHINQLALAIQFPTIHSLKNVWLSDAGASMVTSADQMCQLAEMLTVFVRLSKQSDINKPSVGILNVGTESGKGSVLVKQAYDLMVDHNRINFKGFVEPSNLFDGAVDIAICDGFTGNVLIKTAEASAAYVKQLAQMTLSQSWIGKGLGLAIKYWLKPQLSRIAEKRSNGGLVVGVNGIVIKAHGNSTASGIKVAMDLAKDAVHANVLTKLKSMSASLTGAV